MKKHLHANISTSLTTALIPVCLICNPVFAEENTELENTVVQAKIQAIPFADHPIDQSLSSMNILQSKQGANSNLAQTLEQQVGISSNGLSNTASRPVIRGFSGNRIQLQQNGLDVGDVSALSPDHSVSINPLLEEQIEVLRGASTLLYGNGIVGGLINSVNHLIPQNRQKKAFKGDFLIQNNNNATGNVFDNRLLQTKLSGGLGEFVWNLGLQNEKTGDYYVRNAGKNELLGNSQSEKQTGQFGFGWVGLQDRIGFSWQGNQQNYGIPFEEDVSIRLNQNRFNIETEHNRDWGKISLQASRNNYAHDEIEGDEIATRFRQNIDQMRGQWSGKLNENSNNALGFQLERRQLSALGEESFMPRTLGLKQSLFTVNEIHLDHEQNEPNFEQKKAHQHRFEWGVRYDNQLQNRLNDVNLGIDGKNRGFGLLSGAMGWQNALNESWNIGVQTSYQEKAPSLEELYGNGPHLATGTFEVGNANLRKEKSQNIELSIGRHWFSLNNSNNSNNPNNSGVVNTLNLNQQNSGQGFQNANLNGNANNNSPFAWKLTAYMHRIHDYIYSDFSDNDNNGIADTTDLDGNELINLNYTQNQATLYGWEWEWNQPLNKNWGLNGFVDYTRGKVNRMNIPRLSPLRANIGVNFLQNKWSSRLSLLAVRKQTKLADLETQTAGYVQLNATAQYAVAKNLTVFIEGRNLTNQEIRLHTSLRKNDIPQMGRTIWFGVRGGF